MVKESDEDGGAVAAEGAERKHAMRFSEPLAMLVSSTVSAQDAIMSPQGARTQNELTGTSAARRADKTHER